MNPPTLTAPERARLEACYRAAEYRVFLPDRLLRLALDHHLVDEPLRPAFPAILLSADNPWSQATTPAVNRAARAELKAYLRTLGKVYWPGEGRDPAGRWPSEPSLLIVHVNDREAVRLARRFQQHAWVGIDAQGWVRLCWT